MGIFRITYGPRTYLCWFRTRIHWSTRICQNERSNSTDQIFIRKNWQTSLRRGDGNNGPKFTWTEKQRWENLFLPSSRNAKTWYGGLIYAVVSVFGLFYQRLSSWKYTFTFSSDAKQLWPHWKTLQAKSWKVFATKL